MGVSVGGTGVAVGMGVLVGRGVFVGRGVSVVRGVAIGMGGAATIGSGGIGSDILLRIIWATSSATPRVTRQSKMKVTPRTKQPMISLVFPDTA
jgi:hypothetical protein